MNPQGPNDPNAENPSPLPSQDQPPPYYNQQAQPGYGQPPPSGGPSQQWPPSPYPQQPGYPQSYPVQTNAGQYLGMAILAFFCFGIILGPLAAVKASQGIAAIDAGQADPADRGKLVAARNCGIIAAVLAGILIIIRIISLGAGIAGHHF